VAGESQVQVGQVVPLEIRNIPVGTVITNKVERQVELRLSAPPTLLSTMKPSQVGVALDLADLDEGRHSIHLTEREVTLPRGVKVARIFPPVVEIRLEKLYRKTIPVHVTLRLPSDAARRPPRVEVDPPAAVVEATAAELEQIRAVETEELFVDPGSGPSSTEATLSPPGGHARILEPRTVRVRVIFRDKERR
jgi:YbbR domain-containing protein